VLKAANLRIKDYSAVSFCLFPVPALLAAQSSHQLLAKIRRRKRQLAVYDYESHHFNHDE